MNSFLTSFEAMFARRDPDAPLVERVEIPLIQRDYAQGRNGEDVARIRSGFLGVLHAAVTGGKPICLDFVFGSVQEGTFHPIDGQQRLTTLFLLHWYLAFRASRLDQPSGWKNFTYATRASARLFCERLVRCAPPPEEKVLSKWIQDQAWYLFTWQHDPTIQAMLVMLDEMHKRFQDADCFAAWKRLLDPASPAIVFHLLPIEQDGAGSQPAGGNFGNSDDLYIKMNSRGKKLTDFENFKARFELVLESAWPVRAQEFALKADGKWADLLWPYHGGDYIVDDEFLRYFDFAMEICEWRDELKPAGDRLDRAERIFGPANPNARRNLDFLFHALDTWSGEENISAYFAGLFADGGLPGANDSGKTVVFGQRGGVEINLFAECLKSYGTLRGRNRVFGAAQIIYLYAVLLHRGHAVLDFPRRLRRIRNLVEASASELRLEKMPSLLADVDRIVLRGTLDDVTAFNQAQVADERRKDEMLRLNPELERVVHRLEDHRLLRGCLAAFELDVATFAARANAFLSAFADSSRYPLLTGVLLAIGDYSRQLNARYFQLGSGSSDASWRELLTGAGRSQLASVRTVLGSFLDAISQTSEDLPGKLDVIQQLWLASADSRQGYGWRWYFVKYPCMRTGRSGLYVGENGKLGYSVCMLDKSQMNSKYRDPFLLAIFLESGVGAAVEDPWFSGYETQLRWLHLKKSGAEMRCTAKGFELRAPAVKSHAEMFQQVCARHGVGCDLVLTIAQVERDGVPLDTVDRIPLGAALLRDLVTAGL